MLVAGVDEVGRGSLAGPVTAAAVILTPKIRIEGLKDSKSLSFKKRESLDKQIKQHSVCWNIVSISPKTIDSINILQATLLAMEKAVLGLKLIPERAIFDGLYKPDIPIDSLALVKGDEKCRSIMAASIIAKVARDRFMISIDKRFKRYGFMKHKGYPTKLHINKLKLHGPCDEHRKSFRPVSKMVSIKK